MNNGAKQKSSIKGMLMLLSAAFIWGVSFPITDMGMEHVDAFTFKTMSNLIGAAFFLMVIFAALTSTISLMETIMSIVQDKTGMSRAKAGWLTFALMLLIGVPTSLGFGPLSFISLNGMNLQGMLDFTANSILMPILALLTAIFIVWVVGVETVVDEVKLSSRFKKEKLFRFIIKYIVPVSMVIILVSSILDTFGIVSI